MKANPLTVPYGDYPDLSKVRKVLVVKLRHLGDVLLSCPVFTHLQRAIPQADIDAFVYEEAKPMLEGHPAIQTLIGYDRSWKKLSLFKRVYREASLLRQIRLRGYDLVVNLTEGDRGAIAAYLSGAKIRIGFPPKGKWQKKLYTHIAKHCPGLRHTVERNLDAIRRIGIFPKEEDRDLYFHIGEHVLASMRERVGDSSFILIHPTSRWRFKCWSVSKMRSLIAHLLEEGKKVVLTSGPDPIEVEMVHSIAKDLTVQNFAGKITLKELGALIHLSELLICVDSVPLHIASALKSPVVALFGPTSDITWGPWRNPNARILAKNFPCRPCYQDGCGGSKYSDCLQSISVDEVMASLPILFKNTL